MSSGKQNYKNYINNKEPLKYAILPFDEANDAIYDYIAKNTRRDMWVIPYSNVHKWQNNIKKGKTK